MISIGPAATMRALVVSELADDFAGCALQTIGRPKPAAGEALVAIRAAAINFPDLLMTRGVYQVRPELPFISGMEYSGEVVDVGSGVDTAMIGRAVIGGSKTGAFAGHVCANAEQLRAKPERLDWAEAAAYSATYLTAWVALVCRANVQPGETVLVHGASGGVGLACVDLALHLGARVIAASNSPAKLRAIAELRPAATTLDIGGGFRDAVRALTDGRGADVIVDPVGGDTFDESVRCIAFDGRLLVVGFAGGRIATLDTNMPLIKGFSVIGVRAGEYGRRFPERGAANLAAVDALVGQGALNPHVHATLPLERWRDGFAMLAERQVIGKVVLAM